MQRYAYILVSILCSFLLLAMGARSHVGSLVEHVPINLVGFGNETVWDDLRFPATTLRQGVSTKPDFDETDLGYLMPQNDSGEVVYAIAQFPHGWSQGTDACLHVHWIQVTSLQPLWSADVRWYGIGEDASVAFATLTTSTIEQAYSLGEEIHQLSDLGCIDGSGISGVSSIMDIKFYRDDDVATGDILMKEIDLHYQLDSIGSRTEYVQ